MMFDAIDWRQPWLAPFRALAQSVLQAPDWRQALNAAASSLALRNHRGLAIQFVPQSDLPSGTAYEAFISATGRVPTRDNLHDFFNALVWLRFPRVKARLNALQAAEISSAMNEDKPGSARRGKLRDGATIFDENAALLITSDATLVAALRNHQWREAFIARRALFAGGCCEVVLFGHALMEKLASPYKAITAHAWIVMVDEAFFAMQANDRYRRIDVVVESQLANGLVTADFTPLPVLGVPGWHEPQDDAFYDDIAVFRPKRTARPA